jgi:hypothetical protein
LLLLLLLFAAAEKEPPRCLQQWRNPAAADPQQLYTSTSMQLQPNSAAARRQCTHVMIGYSASSSSSQAEKGTDR